MHIENIINHQNLIETIGRWHLEEWGQADGCNTLAFWVECLQRSANENTIPITYVALNEANEEPLGSVTIVEHNMITRPTLSPWLAALYVAPAHRKQGIASALVKHVIHSAAKMNIPHLYLYTESARGLYERLGWNFLAEDYYEGASVTVMSITTASSTNGV